MAVASTTVNGGIHLGPDTHANRPATALGGAFYSCSTHSLIYKYVTGTGWITYATLAGGSAVLLSTVTAKGDLIVGTGAGTVARQAVGVDGQVVVADSTQTNGIAYANPGSLRVLNAQTGTSYTLVLTDAGKFVTMTNAAASTFTVPPNSSVAFPVGTLIEGVQLGAGQVTITPGAGVTINGTPGLKVAAQYGTFGLLKLATDTWLAMGRLSA